MNANSRSLFSHLSQKPLSLWSLFLFIPARHSYYPVLTPGTERGVGGPRALLTTYESQRHNCQSSSLGCPGKNNSLKEYISTMNA